MRRPLALLAVLVTLLVPAAVAPAAADAGSAAQPVYLALGDSVAAGVGAPPGQGYVPLLAGDLADSEVCSSSDPHADDGCALRNLAAGGATSQDVLVHQLPAAIALLAVRNRDANPENDVELVTITVGGNDVFRPVLTACTADPAVPACRNTIESVLFRYRLNLSLILSALRIVGGEDLRIVSTAYYNPLLPPCRYAGLRELGDDVLALLNGTTAQVSSSLDVRVADAYGQLAADDLVGDCLHPDASGHALLGDLFEDVVLTDPTQRQPGS